MTNIKSIAKNTIFALIALAAIPDNGWGIWVERCIYKENASDWCKVKYADKWGWVNKRYITDYSFSSID